MRQRAVLARNCVSGSHAHDQLASLTCGAAGSSSSWSSLAPAAQHYICVIRFVRQLEPLEARAHSIRHQRRQQVRRSLVVARRPASRSQCHVEARGASSSQASHTHPHSTHKTSPHSAPTHEPRAARPRAEVRTATRALDTPTLTHTPSVESISSPSGRLASGAGSWCTKDTRDARKHQDARAKQRLSNHCVRRWISG